MNKSVIVGLVTLVIIALGTTLLVGHKSSSKVTSSNTASTSSTKPAASSSAKSPSPATVSTTTDASTPMNVTVTANDSSASPETINVKAGQKVNITFAVQKQGTYHAGLDFKSTDPPIDSGSIDQGESKVTSFTATKSFKFTPYWYESNVQKDYFITVNVN